MLRLTVEDLVLMTGVAAIYGVPEDRATRLLDRDVSVPGVPLAAQPGVSPALEQQRTRPWHRERLWLRQVRIDVRPDERPARQPRYRSAGAVDVVGLRYSVHKIAATVCRGRH